MAVNPLSRREVLKFGAYTTVGGVLTPGISLAQAIVTDTKGIIARDEQIDSGGTKIPIYHAGPEKMGKYDRPQAYRKDAAEDAWKHCVAFFDKHLKI